MQDLFFLSNKLFALIISVVCLWLGFWVYFNNTKSKINYLFLWESIFLFLWIITCYLGNSVFITDDPFWGRVAYGIVALFFIPFYYFSIILLNEEKKYPAINSLLIFTSISLFVISVASDLMVVKMDITNYGAIPVLGNGKYIYFVQIFFWFVYIGSRFIINYFKSDKKTRLKLYYFLTGFFIWVLANLIFNVILPFFQDIPQYWAIGNYSAIFLLVFTAYAIVKHELMGIKTLLTQVLIIIISIILFSDVLFLSNDPTMQLLKIGILLTFLYFSRELIKSVRKEREARKELEAAYGQINRYVKMLEKINSNLKEKNEDTKALLEASSVVSVTLDSKKIAQDIADSIPENLGHLKYKGGIIVLYGRDKKRIYTYAITESKIVKKAKEFLDKPFEEYSENIDKVDNLIIRTIKTKKICIGSKLEDFIYPTVSKRVCGLIQKLVGAKSFISIPLFSGGKVMGAIIFVATKLQEEITQRDKDILTGFSSHIGAAIENAQLYEQTNRQMKELAKLNRDLGRANQKLKDLLEMKNEFLHITSHQLRTPLTVIRGMVSMWYEGDFDDLPPGEKKEMLKRIYLSTERLNNITNDMLDALELEGGFLRFQFKPSSLKEIVEDAIDAFKPNFDEKKLYAKFKVGKKRLRQVEVEPNYIRQVFLNVIDNVCKYTDKGGMEIDIQDEGKYQIVIIKDTGIGIAKNEQRKLFEKFTRGRKAIETNVQGSGLGLFIAKKIVDGHHGKIELYSEGCGKGTTVKIYLPAKQG